MKSYVFSAKTKETTLKLIQIKAKFTFFNRHGLRIFFFLFALVPWIFQSFNQLGQNPELQAWKHEAHKENIKKKKKNQPKKTNKQEYPPTTFAVCKNGLRRKESSGAKERSVNNRRVCLRELVILWRFRELKSKGKPTLGWLEYMLYLCTYTVKLFFDFWMCFTILYLFCS